MKRLNKKGFTLVELLAVIVILGVIMLIAVPSVGTIIKNARFNSFVSSGKMYISTAQNYIAGEINISPNKTYYLSIYELNENKLNKSPINSNAYITGYVKVKIDDNGNPTYTANICETIGDPGPDRAPGCNFDSETIPYYYAFVEYESERDVVNVIPYDRKFKPGEKVKPYVDYPYVKSDCIPKEQWLTAHKWVATRCSDKYKDE